MVVDQEKREEYKTIVKFGGMNLWQDIQDQEQN